MSIKTDPQSVPKKTKSFPWRRAFLLLLVLLFAVYLFTHLPELEAILDTLSRGSWLWIFAAILAQVVYYFIYLKMVQRAFAAVELEREVKHLYPLVLGALFLNVLAPTGGNSGTILFADDAKLRKESGTQAVVGYLTSIVASYASFFVLLITAMIFLYLSGILNRYEVIGAIIFVLPTIIPPALLIFAGKKPKSTEKFLNIIRRFLNWILALFRQPQKFDEAWPQKVTEELSAAHQTISRNKKDLVATLGLAFTAHTVNMLSLLFISNAFDVKIHYGALLVGYVFAEVVRVISPNPEGVGAVEAIMVVLFSSFGVPVISATAIAIMFRALNFWAPLGISFLFINRLESFKSHQENPPA